MTSPATRNAPKVVPVERHRTLNPCNRNFGRQDLKEYDALSTDISVGNSEIGGVSVDCRFLFSKSRLGVLRDKEHHGGIIYMNLSINQPLDWSLREANISVILEDAPSADSRRSDRRMSRGESVEILNEYYGPKSLVGPETTAETTKSYNIGPQVDVAGFGGSMGEIGSSVTQPRTSWWNFSGTPKTANASSSSKYTILTWTMSQNTLANSAEHPAKIQTAFAFSHHYQPFLLRVEIEGKLRHLHHRCKDKTIGLFTKAKREKSMLLLFKLGDEDRHEEQILEHAKALEAEMTRAACEAKIIEVNPRISSDDFFASKSAAQDHRPKSDLHAVEKAGNVAVDINAQPDKRADEITNRLQIAHTALMNMGTSQPLPALFPPDAINRENVETSSPGNEVSREEIAEALQQMPTLAWWMMAVLFRVLRAMSKSSEKREQS